MVLTFCLFANAQENFAILVIDVQGLEGIENEAAVQEFIEEQNKVIKWAIRNNISVLYIKEADEGPTSSLINQSIKKSENTFVKRDYDLFSDKIVGKEALAFLKSRNIDSVVAMGKFASICVEATATGALCHGFKVYTSPRLTSELWIGNSKEYPCNVYIRTITPKLGTFNDFSTTESMLKAIEQSWLLE
ncbi:MAG: isochorismatase family protein [Halobacteriovoraceae bacterium]|nr:isochorismatase family protein [Halobacteriovoraceae bacterium]